MTATRFFNWEVDLEPGPTAKAFAGVQPLDPSCCNACATWLKAVERGALPVPVVELLGRAGVDLRKPHEMWGAPEAGFLEGWFVAAGTVRTPPWAGDAADAYVEPAPGFRCWITPTISAEPAPSFAGLSLFQFAFTWQDNQVLPELERLAWPRHGGVPSN